MKKIALLCLSLTMFGCTNSSNQKTTEFIAPTLELAGTVAGDIKECGVANSKGCEVTTPHDDYEQSKMKSMSNEELEKYVKNKSKSK